jgi:hypothetical protein
MQTPSRLNVTRAAQFFCDFSATGTGRKITIPDLRGIRLWVLLAAERYFPM